jgi:hypothetical protein
MTTQSSPRIMYLINMFADWLKPERGRCHLRGQGPEGASPSISTFLSHLWESLKDLHQGSR